MSTSGVALDELIETIHAHPWQMVAVPQDRWWEFTKLRNAGSIEMWTRSDLLDEQDGLDPNWMRLVGGNGQGEGYAVVLVCECRARAVYEVTMEMACDSDDDCIAMQVTALDDLMRPFVDEHNPHRWQGVLL